MIHPLTNDLYQVLCGWWQSYGWPIAPKNILPKRGYVSFIGENPMCAGFLYKDEDADFGVMDYIVCNPDSAPEERATAIDEIEKHIRGVAKSIGIVLLMTMSSTEKLTEKLEKTGYSKMTITALIKKI